MKADVHAATIDNPFVKRLGEAGVIPNHCTKFTLHLEVNHVIKATAEWLLTTNQLEAIASAAEDYPEAVAHFAREHIVKVQEAAK